MTEFSDILFPLFVIAIVVCAIWSIFVLIEIVGGVYLDMWHEEGERKQVSLFVVRMCWFVFVFCSLIVGVVAYLVLKARWKTMRNKRVILRERLQREREAMEAIAAKPLTDEMFTEVSDAPGGLRAGMRQFLIWGCCLFVLLIVGREISGFLLIWGAWTVFLLTFIFSVAGFFGAPLPFGIYHPVYGGFFLHFVQRCLPGLNDLPRKQRQEKFFASCITVQNRVSFEKRHNVLAIVLLGVFLCLEAAVLFAGVSEGDLIPYMWAGCVIVFKILVWDAAMAWLLYHRIKKENHNAKGMAPAHAR